MLPLLFIGTQFFMNPTAVLIGRHLLKLGTGAGNRAKIRKIRQAPRFMQVVGDCRWRVFSMTSHRGKSADIESGGAIKMFS